MPDIHVGDLGTTYRMRIRDNDLPIDSLTGLTSAVLIFKTPGGNIEKPAEVETISGETWLVYVNDDPALHALAGKLSIQGRLIFSNGVQYSTDIETQDANSVPLVIGRNLV
jgi:hypothetical protein